MGICVTADTTAQGIVTDDELAASKIRTHAVLAERTFHNSKGFYFVDTSTLYGGAGGAGAPVWFGPAMAAALAPLNVRLDAINVRLDAVTAAQAQV